ncbi:TorF family putative porin [Thiomicrorhabdus sp. ZW0627]|uniref:TorF family putative porin n=1 Tax=Thiomicrorhabdus sp. ZW0627 TaxID=3039774 RepID=UPI002436B11D|nr:TorF family putative porin [Thiomicrorhabdus sp. ZW0627]MDG6773705.1 TorF family putative porin [Thiomicrorhabdus sp. ZW0627]
MKKTFQLKNLIVSMAIAGSAALSMTPVTAHAEVSYNANVSNMYLWRGQQISTASGVVFGGIDYSHESGLYAGTWTSSEGASGSTEFDLYAGYAPTFGDVTLTFGYNAYFYPDAAGDSYDRNDGNLITEYVLGAAYKGFSATGYFTTEDKAKGDNYKYVSLDYGIGKFGIHYGMSMQDTSSKEYNDINVSYAATDALSFIVSKAFGDGIADKNEKPMLQLTYALPI